MATAVAAQGRTFLVDANNSPGTHFTDLPPAVAAAADGDVLVVLAGSYSGFAVSKGIAILGRQGVIVSGNNPAVPAVDVTNVPFGRTLVLKDLEIKHPSPLPAESALRLQANAGRIHLDGVVPYNFERRPLPITGCLLVTIRNHGTGGTTPNYPSISASTVVIARSVLDGAAASYHAWTGVRTARPGVVATNSSVSIVDCTIRGGSGATTSWMPPQAYGPAPAVSASGCTLSMRGRSQDIVAAGAGAGAYYTSPVPAISAPGSTVEIDPAIPLSSYLATPPITGAVGVVTAPLAALDAPNAALGGWLSPALRSSPADPFVLALGLPSDPTASPIGTLFLDLQLFAVLAIGVQNATGSMQWAFAVPNDPVLRGATFALEAANGYSSGARVGLTNPVLLTLE